MHVYVFTGRTPQELAAAGVGPGTRVCVDRSKRSVVEVGDYLGSYFMDDRAAVTVLLETARRLRMSGSPPARDVYLVLTTNEEVGGVGCTAIVPRVIHVSIVSPLVSDVRRIALGDPVRDRWHAKGSHPIAMRFGYLHRQLRRRKIAARGHPIPNSYGYRPYRSALDAVAACALHPRRRLAAYRSTPSRRSSADSRRARNADEHHPETMLVWRSHGRSPLSPW
jgi:M42 glutamyl aminopeptidase